MKIQIQFVNKNKNEISVINRIPFTSFSNKNILNIVHNSIPIILFYIPFYLILISIFYCFSLTTFMFVDIANELVNLLFYNNIIKLLLLIKLLLILYARIIVTPIVIDYINYKKLSFYLILIMHTLLGISLMLIY